MRLLNRGKHTTVTAVATTADPQPPAMAEGEAPKRAEPDPLPGTLTSQRRDLFRSLASSFRRGQTLRGRKITVSLEDGLIRAVFFDGAKVVSWGTAEAEPVGGPATLGQEAGPDARLRTLLDNLRIPHGRIITDLPFQAPLMRRFHIPKVQPRYLPEVITSEVMETIPFTVEETDLTWQVRKNGVGLNVFATAISKAKVDEHVHLLRQAGLRPRAAYSKATALAHAAGIEDGIIAHCGASLVTLVLVRHWIPEALHQVSLADDPQEQADAVVAAMEQIAGYQTAAGPTGTESHLPVTLTGQVSRLGPLAEALQRTGVPFAPPLKYPEHFPPVEYAVNLGLALADQARAKGHGKTSRTGIPSVNLLPERFQPRPYPIRPVAVFVSLLLLASPALTITKQANTQAENRATLSARVDNLQRQDRDLRLALGRAASMENDTQAASQMASGLETLLTRLKSNRENLLAQMSALTKDALPAGVAVSSLGQRPDGFGVLGTASSYGEVLQLTANLRATGLFTEVGIQWVQASQAGAPGSTAFQILAKVAPPL